MIRHVLSCCLLMLAAPVLAAPPNVLMIVSDDQAWTDFGCMGHPTIKTPRLDQLAAESAVFTRGYVPSSLCRPSLMSMMTGLYPHQHKVSGNDPPPGTDDRNVLLKHIRSLPTLPKILGVAGYQTFQTGKWWEGNYREGGFTHGMSVGDPLKRGRHGDEGLKIGREGLKPIYDFLDECGEKPFFIWYAPMMPHSPHTPPEDLFQKYAAVDKSPYVARYHAMCEWFDQSCGELLDDLDRRKLADNTLVVFVVDNGWIQNPQSPRFAPRSKTSPYEGGIRTPIMLRWPGQIAPQKREELASSIDLLPTILSACAIKADPDLPGRDLLPVCNGRPLERDSVFGEIFAHDIADIDRPAASLQFRWCVHGPLKLIWPRDANAPVELYDVVADPHEMKNLAAERPADVTRFKELIDAWWPADDAASAKIQPGSGAVTR